MARTLAVLVSLTAAACQEPPRPFATEPGHRGNPLLRVSDLGGVVVLPVGNLADEAGENFAREMTKALTVHEIPAATEGGNGQSYFLLGQVSDIAGGDGTVDIRVAWDLMRSSGEFIGRSEAKWLGAAAAWRDAPQEIYAGLAQGAAPEIAALMRGTAASPQAASLFLRPVFILPVDGAPANGQDALRTELERMLRQANLPIARTIEGAGLTVAGRVSLGPPRNGSQSIEIRWVVSEARGRQLGELTQRNALPAGSLDRQWGVLAAPIAQNAANGVLEILERRNREPAAPESAGKGAIPPSSGS